MSVVLSILLTSRVSMQAGAALQLEIPAPMLNIAPILWLQQRASPALTEIMRAVSLGGYVPSCLAVALVCGFGGGSGSASP